MGMSASQARLLSLTARLTDLELNAQKISNSKIRLADESEAVSRAYSEALNKDKLTVYAGVDDKGIPTFMDATAYNLTTYGKIPNTEIQRFLKNSYGQVIVNDAIGEAYNNADGSLPDFIEEVLGYLPEDVVEERYTATCNAISAANAAAQAKYEADVNTYNTIVANANAAANAAALAAGKFKISYDDKAIIEAAGLKDAYNGSSSMGDAHDHRGFMDWSWPSSSVSESTIKTNFTNLLNNYSDSLKTALKANIGGSIPGVGSKLDLALAYAKDATVNKFIYNTDDQDSRNGVQMGTTPTWQYSDSNPDYNGSPHSGKNQIYYYNYTTYDGLWNKDNYTKVRVDNSQIINTFLSYFDKYCAENFLGSRADEVGQDATNRTGKGGTGTETKLFPDPPVLPPVPVPPIPTPFPPIPVPPDNYDVGAIIYYTNVFDEIQENGGVVENDENFNSTEWLYAKLNSGDIFISEWDSEGGEDSQGDFVNISWKTGDNSLKIKSDDTDVARAEAAYQAAMTDIQSKDKRFDLQLKGIDTEHNAIQTEVDSVNKVINKNIEKSFKMFDA